MAWQTACQSLSKSGGPHLPSTTGAINEGARHFRLSRSKRQFIHPSRKIAFGNIALLNLGLTTLIASEFSSKSPRKSCPLGCPRHFASCPASLEHTRDSSTHLALGREPATVSPHGDPHRPVKPRLCSGPSSCIDRRTPHTTNCTATSSSCRCHRLSARPAKCSPQAGNDWHCGHTNRQPALP